MTGIFASTAPAYYAKGLPVIPLYRKEKRPVPLNWSQYHDQPVETHEQDYWMRQYADGNIGLVLGKQSGVVMLDIDTDNQQLIELIKSLVPSSPWVRIGQKGQVMAFRYTGLRTFRIRTLSGDVVCELLSERTQCVLPPSIHPDTKKPYVATTELLDVIDHLPVLSNQIEHILRGALKDAGVNLSISGQSKLTDFVSKGSRDVTLTEKAGLFSYAVVRGERSVKEAIGMLRSFHTEFTERVAGDEVEIEKHVENLLRFLRRDVLDKGKILPDGWDEGLTEEEKEHWGINFDSDKVQWPFDQIRTFLKDQFEAHDVATGSDGRMKAIEKALRKIAHGTLMKLEEERLLQYIVDVCGLGLRLSAIRQRLNELRQGEIAGTDHSEIARVVLKDLQEIYPIRRHASALWRYMGSHWEPVEESLVLAKISNDFGHLVAARKSNDHRGILNVVMNIAESGIEDLPVRGVNFANGFLDENLKLLEHDSRYGMTYTLPFRYMPELAGKSKEFFEFLEQSWGDDEDYETKLLTLQEALCVTLFGISPRYQRAILLRGVPNSGKSQLLKIAQSLVPENAACFVPPNEWNDKFMPTQMHGKLINVCGELSQKKMIDGQRFKDIMDGTEMQGQHKGRDIFTFRPVCAHWFASNHNPRTEDTSEGFNRRWIFLEFNKPVDPKNKKLELGDRIVAEEREAIVAWAVQALPRLVQQRDFTIPPSHRLAIREVAQANNSVRFFMEESRAVAYGPSVTSRISEMSLYQKYWAFCLGPGGVRPVSSKSFKHLMRELQSQLGFSIEIEVTELGGQDLFYRSVTLVDGKTKH